MYHTRETMKPFTHRTRNRFLIGSILVVVRDSFNQYTCMFIHQTSSVSSHRSSYHGPSRRVFCTIWLSSRYRSGQPYHISFWRILTILQRNWNHTLDRTPYHSTTNGDAEQLIQAVKKSLFKYSNPFKTVNFEYLTQKGRFFTMRSAELHNRNRQPPTFSCSHRKNNSIQEECWSKKSLFWNWKCLLLPSFWSERMS